MKIFRKKSTAAADTTARRGHRHRASRSFAVFCVALLAESIAMQLLTQIDTESSGQVAGVQTTQRATGSVAAPTPQPSPLLPLNQIAPAVLAAEPVGPQEVAVVFHSPLRSYQITQYFRSGHPALDMAAPQGTPIYATTVGTVTGTGYVLQGGGLMVKITHPNGYTSYYAHLSAITANVGQRVTFESQIGRVGATGWATGPHLHFMLVNREGFAVNSLPILK